ncbi:hypothetical protein D3C81_1128560 [compost metagenome]
MKVNMHPMRLIDQHRYVETMGQIDDFLQVRAYAKVRRVDHHDRFGIGMALQGAADRGSRNPVVDPQIGVLCRRDEDRLRSGENNCRHHGFMNISRDDNFITRRTNG